MPATSRRARLLSDLLTAKAGPRLADAATLAAATQEPPDGAFFGKGAASADAFRPSYWSYDGENRAPAPAPPRDAKALQNMLRQQLEPAVAAEAEAASDSSGGEHPPVITTEEAIEMQHHGEAGAPETIDSVQAHKAGAAIPDDLEQRVLNYRSYAGRSVETAPRSGGSEVTSDSLLAELASARQARSGEAPARQAQAGSSELTANPSSSLIDRLFTLAGIIILAFGAFLYLSPGHGAAFYGGRSIERLLNTF